MTQTCRRALTLLCAALLLTGALCAALHAAEEPPPKRPTAVQIVRAAEALGSHDRAKRLAAEALLRRAGPAALVALTEAAQSPNRIAATRAETIIGLSRLGISPDTPEDVATLARSYPDATHEARVAILSKLLTHGEHGLRVIRALAMSGDGKKAMREAWLKCRPTTVSLILQNNLAEAEARLWMNFASTVPREPDDPAFVHPPSRLASFLAVRGTAGEAAHSIAGWEALNSTKRRARLLPYLLFADGRFGQAAKAAERTGDPRFVRSFRLTGGGWAELVKELEGFDIAWGKPTIWFRGRMATVYAYLAGNDELLDEVLKQLRPQLLTIVTDWYAKEGKDVPADLDKGIENDLGVLLALVEKEGDAATLEAHFSDLEDTVLTLLLLGRSDEAKKLEPRIKAEFIEMGQLRKKGEFRTEAEARAQMQLALAKFHLRRGRRIEARKLFVQSAEASKESLGAELHIIPDVLRFARVAGTTDRDSKRMYVYCREHLNDPGLGVFLNGPHDEAWAWWEFFKRKYPADKLVTTLNHIEPILTRSLPRKDFAPLAEEFFKAVGPMTVEEYRRASKGEHFNPDNVYNPKESDLFEPLASTCARYGLIDLAAKCLNQPSMKNADPKRDPFTRKLAELYFAAGRWKDAAEVIRGLSQKPYFLPGEYHFMHGVALIRLGQTLEGRRLVEASHFAHQFWPCDRLKLAGYMDWYGFPEAAKKQRRLLLRQVSRPYYAENRREDALRVQMECASRDGNWSDALLLAERCMAEAWIDYLADRYSFESPCRIENPRALLRIRNAVRVARTGEMLVAGKKQDAARLAHKIASDMPLDSDNIGCLVRMFDRAGMKAEADKLYETSRAGFLAATKVLPGEWTIWRDWALMQSHCERDLDHALLAARKAADLEPIRWKHCRDTYTLAVVHATRKEFRKAAALLNGYPIRNPLHCWRMGQIRVALEEQKE
jgi:tetratricopeptide (TPR) repeat protein